MENLNLRNKMKSITLLTMSLVILLGSCSTENRGIPAPQSKRMELDNTSQYYDQNYKVYTLEGCEYIIVGFGNTKWGSHKGNCKNPIHQK